MAEGYVQVPRFIVHLDQTPQKRWNHVLGYYRETFVQAQQFIRDVFGRHTWLQSMVTGLMSTINHCGMMMYAEEMRAVAKQTDLTLGEVVLLQLVYEFSACCTSIVTPDTPTVQNANVREGSMRHLRTMDWATPFLKSMTVEIDFRRRNRTVFLATTWAGFLGVLTGLKPGQYSVSINFRRCGDSVWSNVKQTLGSAWPASFLVREVLADDQVRGFAHAVRQLAQSPLIAPCYITVCGLQEGVILTRNRQGCASVAYPSSTSLKRSLVQTNLDEWRMDSAVSDREDLLFSRQRYSTAHRLLNDRNDSKSHWNGCGGGGGGGSVESLGWKVMNTPPILNFETIYVCQMHPTSGALETRIPTPTTTTTTTTTLRHCASTDVSNPFGLTGTRFSQTFVELFPGPTLGKRIQFASPTLVCRRCRASFCDESNRPGRCAHHGKWHGSLSDCSWSCAVGLGPQKLGQQHWSCCYSTSPARHGCTNSSFHTSAPPNGRRATPLSSGRASQTE